MSEIHTVAILCLSVIVVAVISPVLVDRFLSALADDELARQDYEFRNTNFEKEGN